MRNDDKGFTLIEVAMVMVIIGLILAAAITPLSKQIERSKIQETKLILNDVLEALYGYAATHGRLPCPASATSNGDELPVGGGDCTITNANAANGAHGFVPGRTLGLSGSYNEDALLLDAWGNPIRYSVTQNDTFTLPDAPGSAGADFTTTDDIRGVKADEIAQTPDEVYLNPDLVICKLESPNPGSCTSTNQTWVTTAVAVLVSLGKDGIEAHSGLGITGGDQQENSAATTLTAGPSGRSFLVSDDRVFVDHEYKDTLTNGATGNGPFNDLVIWMSPFTLYNRMSAAGKL